MVNLGVDGIYKRTRVRLHGVDAPNAYKAAADTEAGKVRDDVKRLTRDKCLVEVISEGKGGWIVTMTVFDDDGQPINLNSLMRDKGYVYNTAKLSQ